MTSPRPRRFEDDGTNVTIDLHGCSVQDAEYIIRRTVQEAYRKGRGRVVVIHGKSGTGSDPSKRTIKGALERMIGSGELGSWISGPTRDAAGGKTTLWINIGQKHDAARIKERDVVRE